MSTTDNPTLSLLDMCLVMLFELLCPDCLSLVDRLIDTMRARLVEVVQ